VNIVWKVSYKTDSAKRVLYALTYEQFRKTCREKHIAPDIGKPILRKHIQVSRHHSVNSLFPTFLLDLNQMVYELSKDGDTESISIHSYHYMGDDAEIKFKSAETLVDTIIEHLTLIGTSPIVSKGSKGF
jgi:hypothetical protein